MLAIAVVGCGEKLSLTDIDRAKTDLPELYLTTETGKEVLAPINRGPFVDEETGEICFPAYTCTNPECPGEGKGDRPYLFIHRDVLLKVGSNGELVMEDVPPNTNPRKYIESLGGHMAPTCPACLKNRNPATESDDERNKYMSYVQPYVLPETAKRQAELEELRKQRREEIRRERRGSP